MLASKLIGIVLNENSPLYEIRYGGKYEKEYERMSDLVSWPNMPIDRSRNVGTNQKVLILFIGVIFL